MSPITIEWDDTAERDLDRIDIRPRRQVLEAVERLMTFPSLIDVLRHPNVRRLTGPRFTVPHWRLRAARDWRVIFVRTPTGIRIRTVEHRREVYR